MTSVQCTFHTCSSFCGIIEFSTVSPESELFDSSLTASLCTQPHLKSNPFHLLVCRRVCVCLCVLNAGNSRKRPALWIPCHTPCICEKTAVVLPSMKQSRSRGRRKLNLKLFAKAWCWFDTLSQSVATLWLASPWAWHIPQHDNCTPHTFVAGVFSCLEKRIDLGTVLLPQKCAHTHTLNAWVKHQESLYLCEWMVQKW